MVKKCYKVSFETKELLLCSATKIFIKYGFKGATTIAIAKDSGINKSLIYYHFKSKERLYNEIFQSTVSSLKEAIGELPPNTTLEERVMVITRYLEKKPNFSLLLAQELSTEGKNLTKESKKMIKETILSLLSGSQDKVFTLGIFGAIHFLNIAKGFFESSGVVDSSDHSLPLRFAESFKKRAQ